MLRPVLLALAIALLVTATAHAGTATVHQCKTDRGVAAETDLLQTAGHSEMRVEDKCASGGAFSIISAGGAAASPLPDFRREITVDAPDGTQFVGGQLVRQMVRYVFSTANGTNSSGWGYVLTAGDDLELERCGASTVGARGACTADVQDEAQFPNPIFDLPTTARTRYKMLVGCNAGDQQDKRCHHYKANPGFALARLTFKVRDDAAPTAQATGPLATDAVVRSGEVTITPTDQGLGIYRVRLLVDGAEAEMHAFDPADARCRDVDTSNSDPFEFGAGQPCKTQPGAKSFSFTKLPAGSHNIKVAVDDAAGNQTYAVDRTVTIDPPGPANGTNASAQAKIVLAAPKAATVTVSYSRRGLVRLQGRVVAPNGQGVGNAVLDLFGKDALPGAAEKRIALGNTAPDGSFDLLVPAGASRSLRLVYRDRLGSVSETSAVALTLRVKAGLSFRVKKKGRTLNFSGKVLGWRARKAVQIQVRVGGTWRILTDVKTRTGGAFRYRYALKTARKGEKLRFRAVVAGERGFPYLGAASRTNAVRVG